MSDNSKDKNPIMTAQEVGAYLKIPISTIYDLACKGKIRGIKFGRHWRFLESDIVNYLHGRPVENNHSAERRHAVRIKTHLPAELSGILPDNQFLRVQGTIRNLSEGGLFLVMNGTNPTSHKGDQNLTPGDQVRMQFILPGETPRQLTTHGRVVHLR